MSSRRSFLSTIGKGLAVLPFAGVAGATMGAKSPVESSTQLHFLQYEGIANNKWAHEVYDPWYKKLETIVEKEYQYLEKMYGDFYEWPDNPDTPYQHEINDMFGKFGYRHLPCIPASFITRSVFLVKLNGRVIGSQTWSPFVIWGESHVAPVTPLGDTSNCLPSPSLDIKILNCSVSDKPFPTKSHGDSRDKDKDRFTMDSLYPNHYIQYMDRLIQETPHWWKQYEQVLV